MNKQYRIYTEDVNRDAILGIVNRYVDGYSVYEGLGCWTGHSEKSICIEVIGQLDDEISVRAICHQVKECNKQQAVLYTVTDVKGILIQ